MTIIKSFALPFHSDKIVKLKGESQRNHVSVLLGVNGTQKSSILRGLLEDALSSSSDVESHTAQRTMRRPLTCATKWRSSPPAKVVAISSAATDRFPSKASFGEARFLTRYDVVQYTYVGPRTGRNIVSRTQSVQSLLSEYLQADSSHVSVSNFIDDLSAKTAVPFCVQLRISPRPRDPGKGRSRRLPESLDSFLADHGASPSSMRSSRLQRVIDLAQSDADLMRESARLFYGVRESGPLLVRLDLRFSDREYGEFGPHAIRFGLMAGFIGIDDVELVLPSGERLSPDAFSAGQWGLFSSLATAAWAARDRTLILIDEPENALHPAWQRAYVADLQHAISHRHGCHAVLATHSPLIVSSLSTKAADLIGLRLDADHRVSATLLDVPMGWQVTDVLEDIFDLSSTRSPAIVQEIELAMALIAEGVSKNASKLLTIAKRLRPLLDTLPEEDVARHVIGSICRVSGIDL